MKAAVTFTDTLYLNAEGDANAVFVIQVKGAFSTSVNSKVNLINGALAQNVFWMVDGAVSIIIIQFSTVPLFVIMEQSI